jgi:hypothetical protein
MLIGTDELIRKILSEDAVRVDDIVYDPLSPLKIKIEEFLRPKNVQDRINSPDNNE